MVALRNNAKISRTFERKAITVEAKDKPAQTIFADNPQVVAQMYANMHSVPVEEVWISVKVVKEVRFMSVENFVEYSTIDQKATDKLNGPAVIERGSK